MGMGAMQGVTYIQRVATLGGRGTFGAMYSDHGWAEAACEVLGGLYFLACCLKPAIEQSRRR
jgi:hypothetical protein